MMKIKAPFKIEDKVSGLKLEIIEGKALNIIHIEHIGKPISKNRDFYFTKEGDFDGTGSSV